MSISIPILDGIFRVIDKLIPDPVAKAQAQAEALRMQQAGEFKEIDAAVQLSIAQIEVNKVEAAAPDLFRGGWRPAVGWVCVLGLAYSVLGQPLLAWASLVWGIQVPPKIDTNELLVLLSGMLGFGGFRMVERLRGKA